MLFISFQITNSIFNKTIGLLFLIGGMGQCYSVCGLSDHQLQKLTCVTSRINVCKLRLSTQDFFNFDNKCAM